MKIPKRAYTPEFKGLAVKRVTDGQYLAVAAKDLRLVEQTNWAKAPATDKLVGTGKAVTPEKMELSRLRAKSLRLKREVEIIIKRRRTARRRAIRYPWIDADRQNAPWQICMRLSTPASTATGPGNVAEHQSANG